MRADFRNRILGATDLSIDSLEEMASRVPKPLVAAFPLMNAGSIHRTGGCIHSTASSFPNLSKPCKCTHLNATSLMCSLTTVHQVHLQPYPKPPLLSPHAVCVLDVLQSKARVVSRYIVRVSQPSGGMPSIHLVLLGHLRSRWGWGCGSCVRACVRPGGPYSAPLLQKSHSSIPGMM